MKAEKIDWEQAVKPLIKKYKGKPFPLDYKNNYQLIVMVILSAQSNDKLINSIAPELFEAFPDFTKLAMATPSKLLPYVKKVIGHKKKMDWLITTAKEIGNDNNIPFTLKELIKFPGIGRKSANVILRESKKKAEGVIVDLHVVRVAQRIGITKNSDPKKIEVDIMEVIPQKDWGEVGMSLSFLGREICRPSHPEHDNCLMQKVCDYYLNNRGEKEIRRKSKKGRF